MIIKEKYTKSIKFNKLTGSIVFFSNKKFEIKNIGNLLNSSEKKFIKKKFKK